MFKAQFTALGDSQAVALMICEKKPKDLVPEGLDRSEIELPSEPLVLQQVHGGTVHYIDSVKVTEETRGAFGDGLVVTYPGIAVGVFTADCIPLIIYDLTGKCAAVVHCGWKPVATGIIDNAMSFILNTDGVRPENLRFVMGPGILGDEYEVGPEVANRFPESSKRVAEDKFLLDLPAEIARRISNHGIPSTAIITTKISTYKNQWLPSYRREGDSAGRILTMVWLT